MVKKHVYIIGAGVTGLFAAAELAARGIDVTVYDSKKEVEQGAEKASGVLSKRGLNEAGIPYKGSEINVLKGAWLYAGSEALKIKSEKEMAYVIDRKKLVRLCYENSVEKGAKIELGRKIEREELQELSKSGNIIVGADGAVSTVASTFGFPKINEYILTYKAEYSKAKVEDSEMVSLVFSNRIKRFFGWSVPYSKSKIEIGVGISNRAKTSSTYAFGELLKENPIKEAIEGAKEEVRHASVIPLSVREKTVKRNVLLVGDAAGQVKATTGGGIIFGSLCAKEAAMAIEKNIKEGASLEAYEKMWRAKYGMELRLHNIAHEYYSSLSTKGFERLFKMARIFGMDDFLSIYGDMDSPSRIIKRFFLRGLAE
ncbi:MAG: FAD-dependent oxidoreductase [Candidatus Micrarchaeia archaeon]